MRFETKKEMVDHEKYRIWDNSDMLDHMKYVSNNNLGFKKLNNIKFNRQKIDFLSDQRATGEKGK